MPALPAEHNETTELLAYLLEQAEYLGVDTFRITGELLVLADDVMQAAHDKLGKVREEHSITEEHMERVYAEEGGMKLFDALPEAVQDAEFLCEEAHELDGMAMQLNGFRCPDCDLCRFNRENLLRAHRGQEPVNLGEFLGAEEGAETVTAYVTQEPPAIAAE